MKSERITVRFTEKEIEQITGNAEKYGYTSSEYIRKCVKTAIKNQYIPAAEVKRLFHQLCVNSEFIKSKGLQKIIKEASEKWSLL